ncbi:sensor histidine kinase [Verrucosispora sp. NA02020]|uniref:sensor histidine kinase n=1 Tax=Verrucosispora sp. NA02020 TaxID=2742132 RepID=UPI003D73ECC9
MGDQKSTHDGLADEIFREHHRRLESASIALTRNAPVLGQLRRNVHAIVTDVAEQFDLPASAFDPSADVDGIDEVVDHALLPTEIGVDRALRNIHPIESLRAAALLFEVALPVILRRYVVTDPARVAAIALALHDAISRRVSLSSLAYVNYLIEKLQASRREERRRIARDLHDRLGHSIGLALQNLDLSRHYGTHDRPRADAKVGAAMHEMREALQTVQELTAELRRSFGADGIEPALRGYLSASVPATISTGLTVTGDVKVMPREVGEELYLILREAARNAVRHGEATELRITIVATEDAINAEVIDDGRGFDLIDAQTAGFGLRSMAERADLLNGRFTITSAPGSGTVVAVEVPLYGPEG